jgi:hypothetical protein
LKLTLKKKPDLVVETAEQPMLSELAGLIDKVGLLTVQAAPHYAKIATIAELLKPLDEAKKLLQDAVNALGEDDDLIKELGTAYRVEAGARGSQRKITDMASVKKLMGSVLFMKVATVTLGKIDDYLTPEERATVIKTERTGRSMKVIRRAP